MKLKVVFIMRDYHQKNVDYTIHARILNGWAYKNDKSCYLQVL